MQVNKDNQRWWDVGREQGRVPDNCAGATQLLSGCASPKLRMGVLLNHEICGSVFYKVLHCDCPCHAEDV